MKQSSHLFQSTCWKHFHDLRSGIPTREKRALNQICQAYWKPLYHFAYSIGCQHQDAEDCVQAFLSGESTTQLFAAADPIKGRMRSILLVAFKRFIYDIRKKNNAQKRGGGTPSLSLGNEFAIPGNTPDPSLAYDQQWAMIIVEQAKSNLGKRYRDQGKEKLYDNLEPLLDEKKETDYQTLANTLDLTLSAVKSAIHRIRQRFGTEIRAAVAETVVDENEIDAELSWLIKVLSK
ncbi:RNA polymerase sigma factor [Rubritalea sp.]|uniref:RNA polymerase sigma factor n=1 Tax=Rubritalea sp. TaxID=2109375 RepID=UPI003EF74FCD